MSNRKVHNLVNQLILNDNYEYVNALIDNPSKYFGPKHRKYLHHPIDAFLVAVIFKDPKAGIAALIHQGVDLIPTKLKKIRM